MMKKSIDHMNVASGFAILVILGILACATNMGKLPMPEQLQKSGSVLYDDDLKKLREGRALSITECANCHRFYWPEEYTVDEWKPILNRMASLSSLTQSQSENLTNYFLSAAKASEGLKR